MNKETNEWKYAGRGKKKKSGKGVQGTGEPHIQHKHNAGGSSNTHHGQSSSRSKTDVSKRHVHFTLNELHEIVRKDGVDLMQKLSNQIREFQESLEKFCDKEMNLVLRILIKVTKCLSQEDDIKANAIIILSEIFSTRSPIFQSHLKMYVSKLPMKRMFKENELILVCDFFLELLRVIPGPCWTILPVDELSATIALLSKEERLEDKKTIEMKLQSLLELRSVMREQHEVKRINKFRATQSEIETWDNSEYRHDPIMPQWAEIRSSKRPCKLRKNKIEGEYDDWLHYYDVQFRLLREDFIAPLRKGIQEYREGKRGREVSNVRLYYDVYIKKPSFTIDGLCHEIQFDKEHFKRTNWNHSSRLIFGSLLCLSPDNFTSKVFFATVSNREIAELIKGKVQVMFQESADVILYQHLHTSFVMVESIAFYEGSRHILRSLQLAEESTMPFTKYLIKHCCESIGLPKYLNACSESAPYNLQFIIKDDVLRHPRLSLKYSKVDIKSPLEWPPLEDTELDESQLQAMKMALTQEVAVIQGPPGTGKTFIGLKIVQALLKNSKYWSSSKFKQISGGPILVMCFTNHALDQFLEGIMNLDDTGKLKLIRIGSRSKNEAIQNCSLYNAMQNKKIVPYEEHCKYLRSVNKVDTIKKCFPELSRYSDPIHKFLYFNDIKHVISKHHIQSFRDIANSHEEFNLALEIWLGLYVIKEYLDIEYYTEMCFDNFEEVGFDHGSDKNTSDEFSSDEGSDEDSDDEFSSDEDSDDEFSSDEDSDEDSNDEYDTATSSFDETDNELPTQKEEQDKDRELYAKLLDGIEQIPEEIEMNKISVKTKQPKRLRSMRQTVKIEKCQGYTAYFRKQTQDLSETKFSEYEAEMIEDLHQLHLNDRWELYKYWHAKYRQRNLEKLEEQWYEYTKACEEANAAKKNKEKYALEAAHVIGMTTTGAARYQSVLRAVKPKIVIVEEAAEVLESHIVSALNAGTQHLILIGDHKQLRPKPNDHILATKYNLEISLFERLVLNNFPHVTLQNQHRMRPEIAELVHPLIYDTLYNHEAVLNYENIKGVSKNMFFIDHSNPEQPSSDRSHANEYESKYLIALCMYLLKQGYEPTQITILVTYTGQLLLMKNAIRSTPGSQGVRVCTVDNFQGEENDIILLSVVRSNPKGEIGFLNEDNRVCVSLSRAKCGFYCIGNFTMFRKNSKTWRKIISDMESKGKFGSSLELRCSNHKDEQIYAKLPEDFVNSGCTRDCSLRLPCGHVCPKKCHRNVTEQHRKIKCMKIRSRACPFKHEIQFLCYESHKEHLCKQMVDKECPKCGHMKSVYCYKDLECKQKVEKTIPRCGHTQLVPCFMKPELFQCTKSVERTIPKCSHTQEMKCHINPLYAKCMAIVEKTLWCGHHQEVSCHINVKYVKCQNVCRKLCARKLHSCSVLCHENYACPQCNIVIEETLPQCGHTQEIVCHEDVWKVKCHNKCDVLCERGHSCPLECHQRCQPCRFPLEISPKCGHSVTVNCFEIEKYVCTKKVEKALSCGHKISLPCSEDVSKVLCSSLVEFTLLKCKHTLKVKCHKLNDISKIQCTEKVEKYLACGLHFRTVACFTDVTTLQCHKKIVVTLPCGHEHKISCYKDTSTIKCGIPCDKLLSCGHTQKMPCYESPSAGNCIEPRKKDRFCGHSIKVPCNQDPDAVSCSHRCEKELKCGHNCQLTCSEKCVCYRIVEVKLQCGHTKSVSCLLSQDKSNLNCTRSCPRKLRCGHSCTNMCYEKCTEQCKVMVDVPCHQGVHIKRLPCFKKNTLQKCPNKCEKKLPCGHICQGRCGDDCTRLCQKIVLKEYPCGHKHKVPCSSTPESRPCDMHCKHPLTCSHMCNGRCSDCSTTRIHKPCSSSNLLRHFCGQVTRLPCLGVKSKHTRSTTGKFEGVVVQCQHSKHPWKCYNPIPECQVNTCDWSCPPECPHPKRCTKACSELCNRAPCNERCSKMLTCKRHRCVGLCGEPCIKVCPHCDPENFSRLLKMSLAYSEKQVYIQLPCEHIFAVDDMDKYIHQKSMEREVCLLQCPTCFTPLSCSYRYGNNMKRALLDVAVVKHAIKDRNQTKRTQLLKMYSEAKSDSQMERLKTECPQLYRSFVMIVRKINPGLNPEKEFLMFLFVKIFQYTQQNELSEIAQSIVENLRKWLQSQIDAPKLSFQVVYDLLSEFYRICFEIMTDGRTQSVLPSKFSDKLRNPHFRISTWDFHQMSQKLDRHFAAVTLAEVNQFQPQICNGTWMKCTASHFYCVPSTRAEFQFLKTECFVCRNGSYGTSITVEVPQDARVISQQFVDISSEREKVIMEGQKQNKYVVVKKGQKRKEQQPKATPDGIKKSRSKSKPKKNKKPSKKKRA